jgi:hypothetical protein
MTRQLAELKLRSCYSGDADPVFAARDGKPLKHRNATRRGFELAAGQAGIEGVTFHSMRHAFASRMIDRGISSTVLAALMGTSRARSPSAATSTCSTDSAPTSRCDRRWRSSCPRKCPTLTATRWVLRPCEPLSRSGTATLSSPWIGVKGHRRALR